METELLTCKECICLECLHGYEHFALDTIAGVVSMNIQSELNQQSNKQRSFFQIFDIPTFLVLSLAHAHTLFPCSDSSRQKTCIVGISRHIASALPLPTQRY